MTLKLFLVAAAALLLSCSQSPIGPGKVAPHSGVRLANFDTRVRPQDDFFRYVNGGWLASTDIPADKSNYGAFTMLDDQARHDVHVIIQEAAARHATDADGQKLGALYNSFMDETRLDSLGLQPLQHALDEVAAIRDKSALAAYFARAPRLGGDAPFGFYINNDSKQPDRYIAYFGHSGLGLPDREFYLKEDEPSRKIRLAYLAHIEAMLRLAQVSEAKKHAQTLFHLESAIAELHWPRVDLRNRDLTYNLYALSDLPNLASDFDWRRYIEASGIAAEKEVIIRTPNFYPKFNALFKKTSLADWKLFQQWKLINAYAPALSAEFDAQHFAFYGKVLEGKQTQQPRWERGVDLVNDVLGESVGKLYVAKHFKPEAKVEMLRLVENLREAYRQSILALDWMGEETKQQALEKLRKFHPKIGYPDKWRDYSALEIRENDLLGNLMRAREFHAQYELNKLGKPIDRDEWFMTPQTVNAYYNSVMNEIVFPAAILQPPFFDVYADPAINYGAIGAVIGHEMGHGFDDQGAKSDGDGVLRNWWTEQDLAEFKRRTEVLVHQYNAYEVLPGEFLNGQFTLGENIGDLGGLTIAYQAYRLALNGETAPVMDGFTGDQRFFIGWAQVWARKYRDENLRQRITTDPHSPSEFRTNGVVKNMPEFVRAFDVKEGDALYLAPSSRVKIW